MNIRALLAAGFVALAPTTAAAQLFGNPFADSAGYLAMRGQAPADATYRLRYEVTRVEPNQTEATTSELTIDVAPDWSLTREGESVVLRDFRLNRMFMLHGDTFVSINGLANTVFRVMERQNRAYLQRVASAAGIELADSCDAETELGVTTPSTANASTTEFGENRGVVELRCNGRTVTSFTASDAAAPPPAFWPTAFSAMATHPAMHRRMRESGRAPAQLNVSYRFAPDSERRISWRLIAAETVATPYPLNASLRNATADTIDAEFVAGIGQVAVDAVAGRAQGGAPTLASWGVHLQDVARRDGPPAAAMLVLPTYNMFPELEGVCSTPQAHPVCAVAQSIRTMEDPAPMALLDVGLAEQGRDNAGAIAAMQRAQASPLRDHPALGASFALALLRFNEDAMAQARAANLPTDVDALQAAALRALPYNPAYWTDVGDRFGGGYDWYTALIFYDVAFSLPMPSERHRVLVGKRQVMERIQRDFTDALLPASP